MEGARQEGSGLQAYASVHACPSDAILRTYCYVYASYAWPLFFSCWPEEMKKNREGRSCVAQPKIREKAKDDGVLRRADFRFMGSFSHARWHSSLPSQFPFMLVFLVPLLRRLLVEMHQSVPYVYPPADCFRMLT